MFLFAKSLYTYLFVILQQNGFVIISNSKQSRVSKFDSRWVLGMYFVFSLGQRNVVLIHKSSNVCS